MSPRTLFALALPLLVIVAAAHPAAAQLAFVSSTIDLQADALVDVFEPPPGELITDTDSINEVDLTFFDDSVAAQAQSLSAGLTATAQGSLTAAFDDYSIMLDGNAFSSFWEPGPFGGGDGAASVLYEVVFSVSVATPYSIGIELIADSVCCGDAYSRVALASTSGTIFDHEWTPTSGSYLGTFEEIGVLAPGTYTLSAEATSSSFDYPATGDFVVDAAFVPEPGTGLLVMTGLALACARRRRAPLRVRR